MRITIEPTETQDRPMELQHPKIIIDYDGDDHTLYEVLDYLISPALKAWGFTFDGLEAGAEWKTTINER